MGGSLRIARVAGIDIQVHATFLLVVLLGAYQWGWSGWTGALFGAALTVAIFVCVALHELGHSLVARAFGITVRHITLLPIGGVAVLTKRPAGPGQELLVSVAGPLVNVVLAAGLWLLEPGWGASWWRIEEHTPPSLQVGWGLLFGANVGLALFNLVPAFPMDGGRMFRAVLSWFLDLERATRWAANVGRLMAVALFALGVSARSPTLPVLALFVFFGAGSELKDVQVGELLRQVRLGDAVNPYMPRFGPETTFLEAMQALLFTPAPAFAVEVNGALAGVVTREALLAASKRLLGPEPLQPLWETGGATLSAQATLEDAREAMSDSGRGWVAVESEGTFIGLVTELELLQHARTLAVVRRQLRRPGTG